MKKGIYRRLARMGIQKNKKLYTPYILTCIGMVMMFYIILFLSISPSVRGMAGGDTMQLILRLGSIVMGFFAAIFLFYTNSVLMRRRKKEFGLYNILGMGKKNLAAVMFWETVYVAALSLSMGLLVGILFSKLAELCLINILKESATFTLSVEWGALRGTLVLFAVIFLLLLANSLRQIQLSNPMALLRSENVGEKPPKANWLFAVLGAVLLAAAYWMAVTIEDTVTALFVFFGAVILVIIATYLLFIAGSVTVCRFLQRRKNYYYKTNHFVSISSMAYRMKRNGAGLASICILCTMVLVMVSSTVCLYVGAEDSLRIRYPRHINLDVTLEEPAQFYSDEVQNLRAETAQRVSDAGAELYNVLDYRVAGFVGYVSDGRVWTLEESVYNSTEPGAFSDAWQVFLVSIEDYNRLMGANETLQKGEVLIYTTRDEVYEGDTIAVGESESYVIKEKVKDFADNGIDSMQVIPSLYIFVPNFEELAGQLTKLLGVAQKTDAGADVVSLHWFYGFDLSCDQQTQVDITMDIEDMLPDYESRTGCSVLCEGALMKRTDYYALYGGLFFLGVLLGIVFLLAAVLIIYYKQVSEGYEDQSRFAIMQKVGMTRREIWKSVNSQVLTVFFLPVITAGLHLAFAFPLISKMLALFNVVNVRLLIFVTICCYLVFVLFYVIIYHITSRAYYSIVSGGREDRI